MQHTSTQLQVSVCVCVADCYKASARSFVICIHADMFGSVCLFGVLSPWQMLWWLIYCMQHHYQHHQRCKLNGCAWWQVQFMCIICDVFFLELTFWSKYIVFFVWIISMLAEGSELFKVYQKLLKRISLFKIFDEIKKKKYYYKRKLPNNSVL